MSIRVIKLASPNIAVVSPYNATFVSGARRLAGRWGSVRNADGSEDKAWIFPIETRGEVSALLREVYGEDGQTETPTVRLRVEYHGSVTDDGGETSVVIGGREVARVYGRDSGARLGPNVVLRVGGVGSGGSRKNYRIEVAQGTVFDLLRMPVAMAERLVAAHPDSCRVVTDDGEEIAPDVGADNVVALRGGVS